MKLTQKTMSLLLAVLFVISGFFSLPVSAQDSQFAVSLNWNGSNDETSLEWNATTSQNKVIRLNVNYQSMDISHPEFAANSLQISVNGMGAATRAQANIAASSVAADDLSSIEKKYDWSYTYSSSSDTYTFYNNNPIASGATFSGSFELLWEFNPRNVKNNYQKTFTASTLRSGITGSSNTISFSFTSLGDTYTMTQNPTPMSDRSELRKYTQFPSMYQWVTYEIDRQEVTKARGTKSSYYEMLLGEDVVVASPIATYVNDGWYKINTPTNKFSIAVGYPKAAYMISSEENTVTARGQYTGIYNDETQLQVLATANSTVNLNDYGFSGGSGGSKNSEKDVKVKYEHLFSGNKEYLFYFDYSDAVNATNIIGDDFVDVLLNSGEFRELEPEEYEITSVYFPCISDFEDEDGNSLLSTRTLQIWTRSVGDDSLSLFYSGIISGKPKWITAPSNTYQMQYRWVSGSTCYSTQSAYQIKMIFHVNDESGLSRTEKISYSGEVRNLGYRDWYGNDNIHHYGNETNYTGTYAPRNIQRDMDAYGHLWRRTYAKYVIYKGDNYYGTYTELGSFTTVSDGEDTIKFTSTANITSDFTIDEDIESEPLSTFNQYTVLPDGLSIDMDSFTYSTTLPDLLLADGTVITHSTNYFKTHTTVTVTENYRNSSKTYINFSYDFSDNPLIIESILSVNAVFDVFVSLDDYKEHGETYTLYGVTMISEPGQVYAEKDTTGTPTIKRYSSYASIDSGLYYNHDIALWTDLNNDAETSQKLSYNYNSKSIVLAMESYQEIKQTVKSVYTDGKFRDGKVLSGLGNDYAYKLSLSTGSSRGENIVFTCILENTPDAEWKGTFSNVDTSYAQSKGLTATVYYAQTTTPGSGDWTTTRPSNVAAVRVGLSGTLASNSMVYVLVNMVAPNNASLVGDITENEYSVSFDSIDLVSGITTLTGTLPSNKVQIELVKDVGNISIIKTDAEGGFRLEGAVFDIYKYSELLNSYYHIKTVSTNATGTYTLKTASYGQYYIVETAAPAGYLLNSEPIYITLDDAHVNPETETFTVSVPNTRLDGGVKLVKSDSNDLDLFVSGAVYSLYTSTGTIVSENHVTNQNGEFTINGMDWGAYYFLETQRPFGYELNESKIHFEIDATNAGTVITVYTTDEPKQGNFRIIKYDRVNSESVITTNGVESAMYDIYRVMSNGQENYCYLEECITDNNGVIKGSLPPGHYYAVEYEKAVGYSLNTDRVEFDITPEDCESGTPVIVSTHNVRINGTVNLIKTNDKEEPLRNAVYSIYNEDNTVYQSNLVTNAEGIITVSDIPWGSYYFLETDPPDGYEISTEKIYFTINQHNAEAANIYRAIDTQTLTDVELIKVSENDNSVLVPGATYALFRSDYTMFGQGYTTNENGALTVEDVPWGSYFFMETSAPEGYGLTTERLYFSINSNTAGTQIRVTATDPVDTRDITVTKRIKADDIYWTHGYPVFTFRVESVDNSSPARNCSIAFDAEYVAANTDSDGYVEKTSVFAQLDPGTYVLTERDTLRYEVDSITVPPGDIGMVYRGGDGSSNSALYGNCVLFDLTETRSGRAVFTNKKTEWGRASDTSNVTNVIKASPQLVGLRAESSIGMLTVNKASLIDRSLLNVFAVYSDGTSVKLADNAYSIEEQEFAVGNEEYVISVNYTEDGITRSTTFSAYTYQGELFTYMKLLDGTWAITGYNGTSNVVVFPSERNGIAVTQLGNGSSNITGLDNAETIKIPDSVVCVEENAFSECTSCRALSIPISTIVSADAFVNTDIYSFTITPGTGIGIDYKYDNYRNLPWLQSTAYTVIFEEGIEYIGKMMFADTNLAGQVKIPDTVTEIGAIAFSNCYYASSLVLGDNLRIIGEEAFSDLGHIPYLTIPDSVEIIKYGAFCNLTRVDNLVIPHGVTYIGDWAFSSLGSTADTLIDLQIPDTVTYLGEILLLNCPIIKTISIPASIETIGNDAFYGMDNLETIYIDKPYNSIPGVPWTSTQENPPSVIWNGNATRYDDGSFIYEIANGEAIIRSYHGDDESVIIPQTYMGYPVTTIGFNAFSMNPLITSVRINNNITTLESGAFAICLNLKTFNFQNNKLEYIGASAFQNCEMLSSELHLTDTLEFLGEGAFSNCYKLRGSIYISDSIESIDDFTFSCCHELSGDLIFPDSVTYIGTGAFEYCRNLGSYLVLPDSLTEIKYNAFYETQSINFVTWPSNLKMIDYYAFQNSGITGTLDLPDSVEHISLRAFYGCGITGALILPDSLETLNQSAFENCKGITSLVFGTKITKITNPFPGCTGITGTVVIPESVTEIQAKSFNGLYGIEQITFLNSSCSIYANAATIDPSIKISGYVGSTAQAYATRFGRTFIPIE